MISGIRWGNLYKKILAWVFIPTVTILLMVVLGIFYVYETVVENLALSQNQELIQHTTRDLARVLTQYSNELAIIAKPIIQNQQTPNSLDSVKDYSESFDGGLVLLNKMGVVVAAKTKYSEIVREEWSKSDYFRQLKLTTLPSFSDLILTEPNSTAIVAVAVPLFSQQGESLGTLIGLMQIEALTSNPFFDNISKLYLSQKGIIYLVDGYGRVLFHSSNPQYLGEDFSAHLLIQQALNGQSGTIFTKNDEGQDIIAGFAPIPGTSWNLLIEKEWQPLPGFSQNYRLALLVLLGLGITLPIWVLTLGVRQITKPIEKLTEAAQEVARGSFSQVISAPTGDEIEKLAGQFNLMAAQLRQSYANLEQRVTDRTRELATLTKQFAILNAISASVNESLDLSHILNRVLDETLGLLNLEVGAIYLLDRETDELVIHTHHGLSQEFTELVGRFKVTEILPELSIRRGEPVINEDVSSNPPGPFTQNAELRSLAIFPLRARETMLGILGLGTRRGPRRFTREERELLGAVSDQAAVAIENAQLYAETSRRVDEIETLFAVQQAITSRLDLATVLQLIADEARRLTSSRVAVVFMLDGDELCVSVLSSEGKVNVPIGYRMPITHSITAEALRKGQALWIDHIEDEPRAYPDLVKRLEVHSLMVLPLMSGLRPIGSISLVDKLSGKFNTNDERVLNMLASSAVIGLENARLYQEQQARREEAERRHQIAESLRDILTVLNSSRPLEEILSHIVAQADRLLGADAGAIYRLQSKEGPLRVQAAQGLPEAYITSMEIPVGEALVGRAVLDRQPVAVPDVAKITPLNVDTLQLDPQRWPLVLEVMAQYHALLAVPLIIKNEVYGGIVLYYSSAREFSEEEIGLAVSFADQVALAIENARLFDQAEQAAILEERQRLARELHDSVTQALYGVTMFAEAATRLLTAGKIELAADHLSELRSTAQEALQEMRLLLFELRPPVLEQEGLMVALQTRLEAVERRSGLVTELRVEGDEDYKLPAKVEDGLYRIAQEALNNALKHAQARQIQVYLYQSPEVAKLEIIDDGYGFDLATVREHAGLGLRNIEERSAQLGAQLTIRSHPNQGTKITVELKL